jgi:hypothetical protein
MLSTLARRCSSIRRVAAPLSSVRYLNVHEYESMDIMHNHGIAVPECYVANTPDEAKHIFESRFNSTSKLTTRFSCAWVFPVEGNDLLR